MAFAPLFTPIRVGFLSLAVVVAGLAPASAQTTGAQTPAAPAGATPPPLPAPETVVARVGDQDILMADLLDMYSRLPQQYRERPIQMLFPSLRDRAIDSRLLGQAALDAKVGDRPVAKRRIRAAIDDVVAQIFLTEKVEAMLTEEVLRARYDAALKAMAGQGGEVRARHILLAKEDEAQAVIAELEKGADFATLAQERSTGPSKTGGGDLGWFSAEQMVPAFSEAAFALQAGEYTKAPVQTQFGWHVIKVEEVRPFTPPSFAEMRNRLSGEATREIVETYLNDLRDDVAVERFNLDGSKVTQ